MVDADVAVERVERGDISGVGPELDVDSGQPCKASRGVVGGVIESIIFFMP